jgi:hypothetical protein
MRNRQVQREALQRQQWLGGAYRDPLEASARLAGLIEEANGDLEATAWRLREIGPEGLGALRGKEGWLASRRAVAERRSARGCAAAIVPGLAREAAASRFAIRAYQEEVTQQHERDAIEVPELSLKARAVLEGVRIAMLATVLPRDGEGYDARMARRAAGVAEQWAKGQADPALAQEIDRFVAAATARLGANGVAAALRAAGGGPELAVPGTDFEHRAALQAIAQGLAAARNGPEQTAVHQRTVERQHRERERLAERQPLGLSREEPSRDHDGPSLGW